MFHVDFLQCDSGDAVRIPERTRGRGRPPLRTLMGAHHPRDGKQSGDLERTFGFAAKFRTTTVCLALQAQPLPA